MSDTRYEYINVGVDGSEESAQAVLWAAGEAQIRSAPLRLIHGYSITAMAGPVTDDLLNSTRDWAAQVLADAVSAAQQIAPQITISTELELESAVPLLIRLSEDAQLTVVGTHGASKISDALFGSVAMRLAGHAHGAVLVVRADQPAPTSPAITAIVLGLDGSPGSEQAAEFAFDEAERRDCPLIIVRTWNETPVLQGAGMYPVAIDFGAIDNSEFEALQAQVAPWRDKHPGVSVELILTRGRPAQGIADLLADRFADAEPGMVVVGSRGRGGFTGLFLGSTSQSLVAHSTWPVAVIRRS